MYGKEKKGEEKMQNRRKKISTTMTSLQNLYIP